MENPTREQLIATGFNRNHPYSIEGGIIDEEYRVMYANDKTTTAAWRTEKRCQFTCHTVSHGR